MGKEGHCAGGDPRHAALGPQGDRLVPRPGLWSPEPYDGQRGGRCAGSLAGFQTEGCQRDAMRFAATRELSARGGRWLYLTLLIGANLLSHPVAKRFSKSYIHSGPLHIDVKWARAVCTKADVRHAP